ncbi:MAG: hypothetical protein AAGC63_00320 [Propionicimonas sp.]|nr:hypothetical protein [Propionicimonas sp.]
MSDPTITPNSVLVQFWKDGAWEDISSYVRLDMEPILIRRGRTSENGRVDPGRCTFVLDNADGRFSEQSTTSPYTGWWKKWAPLRVQVNGKLSYRGYLRAFPTVWRDEESQVHAYARVACVDAMAVLAASPAPLSWGPELIEDLSPSYWWKLDDAQGSLLAAPAVVGTDPLRPMEFTDSARLRFGGSMPDTASVDSVLTLEPRTDSYPGLSVSTSLSPPFTILAVHNRTEGDDFAGALSSWARGLRLSSSSGIIDLRRPKGTSDLRLESWVDIPELWTMQGSATLPGVCLIDEPILIALVFTTASVTAYAAGNFATIPFTIYSASLDLIGDTAGAWSNLAVVPSAMSAAQVEQLQSKVVGSGALPVSDWLQRAVDAAGVAATVQVLGYDRPMLRPDLKGSTPAAIGDDLADAAGAMWVADRASGAPTWIDHRYVAATVHVDAAQLRPSDLQWGSDDSLYVTGAEIDGKVVAERADWPKVNAAVSELLPEPQRTHRAHWVAYSGDVVSGARLSGVRLDLAAMPDGHTNRALDPAGTNLAASGPGRVTPRDLSAGTASFPASGGPTSQGGPATFARWTCTTSGTFRGRFDLAGDVGAASPTTANLLPAVAGEQITVSVWVRSSAAATYRLDYRPAAAGAWTGSAVSFSSTVATTAGVWTRISGTITVPAGATAVGILLNQTGSLAVGVTSDATGLLIEDGSTVGDYGDGSMTGWTWQGLPNRATSTFGVDTALALDVKSRIYPDNPPPQVPTPLWISTIEGYVETIGWDQWTKLLNTAPDPRLVIEDPIAGVVGAGYRIGY